jgi:hypothetical protein
MKLKWKIYYGDGLIVDNAQVKPEMVPSLDVQVICEREGRNIILIHSKDFYWHENDLWTGGDIFGLWDYLSRPGFKKVLFGRTISTDNFNKILTKVIKEKEEL